MSLQESLEIIGRGADEILVEKELSNKLARGKPLRIKAGFDPKDARRTWIKMNRWQSVMRRPVRFVMNLDWFRQRGLVFLNDFTVAFSRA